MTSKLSDVAETATIDAPIERVWEVVAATDRYAEWVDACIEVTDHHGQATIGRTYSERNKFAVGIKIGTTWTVADADAPRLRRDTGTGFPLMHDVESLFELTPARAERTEITYRARYRFGLGPLGRLIDRLQQPTLRAGQRRSLQALARLLADSDR